MPYALHGNWTCPYCGHANRQLFTEAAYTKEVAHCDHETGGCGQVVLLCVTKVEVVLKALRVEGTFDIPAEKKG